MFRPQLSQWLPDLALAGVWLMIQSSATYEGRWNFPRTDEEKARQRERIIREANRRRGI